LALHREHSISSQLAEGFVDFANAVSTAKGHHAALLCLS
jgi:hypothetical protein